MFFQNKLKDHFRHATSPATKDIRSFQVIPLEILHRFTGDKKVAGTLGKLCEIYQIIIWILMINVDGGFASHETDISITGDYGSCHFVGTKAGHQSQINPFLFKISIFNCYILWGVEDGMCHFI